MSTAFWDASALVSLCVEQASSGAAQSLLRQYEVVVWWATSVELRSAFERLRRTGQPSESDHAAAGLRMEKLRASWQELLPTLELRSQAEKLLAASPLKAADALQLAAAWTWCMGKTANALFISGDMQLLNAAKQAGFQVTAV